MENITVWSFVCECASTRPLWLGWIRKTSDNLGLPKKAFAKDIYKLQILVGSYLKRCMVEIGGMIYSGIFNNKCEECFTDYPNVHLNNVTYLLRCCQSIQKPFSLENFTDYEWHYQYYKDVDWAKEITVAQFIQQIVDDVVKYYVCSKHTDNLTSKREKLALTLKLIFQEEVDCLVLLSISCNYNEDSFGFSGAYSPFAASTSMPQQIFHSILRVINSFNQIEYK